MAVSVQFSLKDAKRRKLLQKMMNKYPAAANAAMRSAGFFLQGKVIDKFLTVQDGRSRHSKARRQNGRLVRGTAVPATRRTKPDGLRVDTGLTRRSLGVGLILQGGRFLLLSSKSSGKGSKKNKEKFVSAVQVGISSPRYAVDHEKFGRKRKKGFYPFLKPALKMFKRQTFSVFDKVFIREVKKAKIR